ILDLRRAGNGIAALVPTLCVGTHVWDALRPEQRCSGRQLQGRDAERRTRRSHALRGNEEHEMPLTHPPNAEWLEADGLGGFASGTVAGPRTRRYHALLLTPTTPPPGPRAASSWSTVSPPGSNRLPAPSP